MNTQLLHGKVRQVAVGIMSGGEIRFSLNGTYRCGNADVRGERKAVCSGGKVVFEGRAYAELRFNPQTPGCTFTLNGVTIGKKFHWERQENETFAGTLKLIPDGAVLHAINIVDVETYLQSVISSEMSGTAPMEYLKTQAVVSRSWLVRILFERDRGVTHKSVETDDFSGGVARHIAWYENDNHKLFDVCADDHCQRYEGVSHIANPNAERAVAETCGEVIMSGGGVCDARFSKCCGGVSERFPSCWEDSDKAYLQPVRDSDDDAAVPDLSVEANAEQWIRSAPGSFCKGDGEDSVLFMVLNDYDLETHDFYRWREEYTNARLAALLRGKTGTDFGEITDLKPLRRGASGRIVELLVTGTKARMIIGKELEIRRSLSESHLKSSAFVVDRIDVSPRGIPARFVLVGAGWGHGVGLCQIGAAIMSSRGYGYREIIAHYFKDSKISNIYGNE